MRVIFMGTPDFAVGTLEEIIKAGHEVVLVVSQPDKAVGRSKALKYTPVKECAVAHGIEVYQPAKIRAEESVEYLRQYNADIIIVEAFGQIIPKAILDMPRFGCVNVHASLLPKYRGAAPIQWAVLNGDQVTGVTTMRMDEGLDTGDMIMKQEVIVDEDETGGSLFDKLSEVGAKLCVKTMEAIENGATQVTHLYNAMTPMHHRKPGVVTAALRSNVYTEMICDTIHVHPAMFQFVMDCKGKDKFVLITDCMRAGGMPQGEYTLGELKVVVDATRARLMDGTLAGSILTLNKAIDNVHKNTNKPLWEIVSAASLNPARAMGMQDRIGSLRAGCNADFAVFDDDFNTQMTIVDGRVVYQK